MRLGQQEHQEEVEQGGESCPSITIAPSSNVLVLQLRLAAVKISLDLVKIQLELHYWFNASMYSSKCPIENSKF